MKKYMLIFGLCLINPLAHALPNVEITTNKGIIKLELDAEKAPKTVENFVQYVNDGFYSGTIFHRVIADFMIQGGGMGVDMKEKETRAPIAIESDTGLKNLRGTIAMARTRDPNSATSQFFINVKDNAFLDFTQPTVNGYGYAVFGKVTEGMDIVDAIATTATDGADVPQETIMIAKIEVINDESDAASEASETEKTDEAAESKAEKVEESATEE